MVKKKTRFKIIKKQKIHDKNNISSHKNKKYNNLSSHKNVKYLK